ncbi:MAG: GHMP kinase [Bacilli bacterium]|jgi:D-glycero-alpha-D-manno-heptose-7-phosphate kinase|nr:GHMP kinase [Bacilli bacterium]
MIISRAPFRVSFCGGGSDIPSFYEKYGGCVISTSIRKYVYITINRAFNKDSITLKYSQTEIVNDPSKIKHRIFRQVLGDFGIKGIEITSMADIPSGTGLGSSSSFTVALLRVLYAYCEKAVSTYKLAKEACDVEINQLGNPIGKQDQFAAAFGGLRYYEFFPDGFVNVEPIVMRHDSYKRLQDNLLMFYTGDVRDANSILGEETKNLASQEDKINATRKLVEMTKRLKLELENNNIDAIGPTLKANWEIKKGLANGISKPVIDQYYESAMAAGATGGKLLGAGGGGFLLFYCPTHEIRENVRKSLMNLKEMEFEFDQAGCTILMI